MRSHLLLTLTGALVSCGVGLSVSQEPVESAPELTAGIQAYKDARYEEAQHTLREPSQDPANVRAHLYLATTLAQEFIPGTDSPENNAFWAARD